MTVLKTVVSKYIYYGFFGGIKMYRRKGFTLIELMVVVLIVSILAAVIIPILRGRIDAAKWSEGKAMMGTIATGIRSYHAEHGPTGQLPTANNFQQIGIDTAHNDLQGRYFAQADFQFSVSSMDPLTFTITCTPGTMSDHPEFPASRTLNQAGIFSPE